MRAGKLWYGPDHDWGYTARERMDVFKYQGGVSCWFRSIYCTGEYDILSVGPGRWEFRLHTMIQVLIQWYRLIHYSVDFDEWMQQHRSLLRHYPGDKRTPDDGTIHNWSKHLLFGRCDTVQQRKFRYKQYILVGLWRWKYRVRAKGESQFHRHRFLFGDAISDQWLWSNW